MEASLTRCVPSRIDFCLRDSDTGGLRRSRYPILHEETANFIFFLHLVVPSRIYRISDGWNCKDTKPNPSVDESEGADRDDRGEKLDDGNKDIKGDRACLEAGLTREV